MVKYLEASEDVRAAVPHAAGDGEVAVGVLRAVQRRGGLCAAPELHLVPQQELEPRQKVLQEDALQFQGTIPNFRDFELTSEGMNAFAEEGVDLEELATSA